MSNPAAFFRVRVGLMVFFFIGFAASARAQLDWTTWPDPVYAGESATVVATYGGNPSNLGLEMYVNGQSGTKISNTVGWSGTLPSGSYQVQVMAFIDGSPAGTLNRTLVVNPTPNPPTITTQPSGQSINSGQTATLTVTASSTAPMQYQWKRDGTNVAGGQATLSIPNAGTGDAGTYTVVVSNAGGSVTSSGAALSVNPTPTAPVITAFSPAGYQTIDYGGSAALSVTASGTAPLSYQWRRNSSPISGANASTYNIPYFTNSSIGTYAVTVTNVAGSVTSSGVSLSLYNPNGYDNGPITLNFDFSGTAVENPTTHVWHVPAGATLVAHAQSTGGSSPVNVHLVKTGGSTTFDVTNEGGVAADCTETTNVFAHIEATAFDGVHTPVNITKDLRYFVPDDVAPSDPTEAAVGVHGITDVVTVDNNTLYNFKFTWNKSTDNQVIDFYEVQLNDQPFGMVPSGYPDVAPAATYWMQFSFRSPNTTYKIAVRAWDWAGNPSNWYVQYYTTPIPDTQPPTVPTGFTHNFVNGSTASVSWNPSTDNGGGIVTDYIVKLYHAATATGPSVDSTVAAPLTTAYFNGLVPFTDYTVTVAARDNANPPNVSNVGTHTFTLPPVTRPADLTASNVTARTFTLTWSPVVDGTVIAYYEIETDNTVAPGQSANGPLLFRTLPGFDPNTTHFVRVRSVDNHGNPSLWSDMLSVTTDVTMVELNPVPRPTGSGSLVAAAGGSVSVDNRGSANYSIPLRIAPGRLGPQPSLSLNYNSGAGNGPLGLGWSLATGFPQAITRGRSILARDGVVRGVTFTSDDKFYLDGKRLVLISGTYGSPNSVYRTEVDSFITVTALGDTFIDRFEVVDKSGLKMTFGALGAELGGFQRGGSDSNQWAYSYALAQVRDTLGNYVTFTYTPLGGGEYVLARIDYADDSGTNPQAKVTFDYENRPDQPVTFLVGRYFDHRARLAVITAQSKVGGGFIPTAAYGLIYDLAPAGGRSRLTSVAPLLADPNTQALVNVPATMITWQDYADVRGAGVQLYENPQNVEKDIQFGDTDGDGADNAVFTASGTFNTSQSATLLADIDGDGKKDQATIVVSPMGGNSATVSCTVKLAKDGTMVEVALDNAFVDPGNPGDVGGGTMILANEGLGVVSRFTFADFTGDGRDDLLLHGVDGRLRLLVSNGTSFAAPSNNPAASPNVGGAGDIMWSTWSSANGVYPWIGSHFYVKPIPCDLNGDGRMDYACITYNRIVNYNIDHFTPYSYFSSRFMTGVLSKPDGTFSEPFSINTFFPTTTNGDASVTPVVPPGAIKLNDVNSGAFPGDFNGDGLTDFLCLDNKNIQGQRWLLLINKGEGPLGKVWFESHPGVIPNTVTLPTGDTVNTWYTPMISSGGPGYYAAAPLSFFGTDTQRNAIFAGVEGAAGSTDNLLMDVNHDGLPDLVWYVRLKSDETEANPSSVGWWAMLATGTYPAIGSPVLTGFTGPVRVTMLDGIDGGRPWGTTGLNEYHAVSINSHVDYDGDGHEDLFVQETVNGKPGSLGDMYLTRAADGVSTAPFGDLVKTVTDGLHRATGVKYTAAKDRSIYTSGVGVTYPIRELLSSAPVVSEVTQDSGGDTPATFLYQYAGRRIDLAGRGDLGYHSFVTLDQQTGLFKYQFLAQSFPMTGLTNREETYRALSGTSFNLISSHDNTVVFDKVMNQGSPYGTVWPYISRATEYRWEDGAGHLTTTGSNLSSDPENLFAQPRPTGTAHIAITATSRFDGQSAARTDLPPELVTAGYHPSDVDAAGRNTAAGTRDANADPAATNSLFSHLPGEIALGNLTDLATDFGGGYSESVHTVYADGVIFPGTTSLTLTGRPAHVDTAVTSPHPDYASENAPTKIYDYEPLQPALVKYETVVASAGNAAGASLDLKTTYMHDSRGRVTDTAISSSDGSIGAYSVASAGNFNDHFDLPQTTQDAEPYRHATATVYHPFLGLPTSVTDVNGAQVTSTYDALGRTTNVTDVLHNVATNTSYALAAVTVPVPDSYPSGTPTRDHGLAITSVYSAGVTTTVKPSVTTYYDRLGRAIRTVKETFGGQTYADTVYNALGQVVAATLPYIPPDGTASGGKQWTYTSYDDLGRVVKVTAPNGTVTTTAYAGRTTTVTVAAPGRVAQVNQTLVDAKGHTVQVWNPDPDTGSASSAPSITFDLDGFGRMRATTLAGQTQTIRAEYDALGRQRSLNDPDKGSWAYINNALGQVVSQTDGRGTVTASTFDHLGRPLARTTTELAGPVENAAWYYYDSADDATNHLVAKDTAGPVGMRGWIGALQRDESATTGAPGYAAANSATKTLHYYNALGLPSRDVAAIDGKLFYTETGYDSYSRPISVRHFWKPSGVEDPTAQPFVWQDFGYTYAYDGKSYLTALTDSLGRSWWDSANYDYLDRVTSVRTGAGYTTTRAYRASDGALTGITTAGAGHTIQNLGFTFDGLGNLTQRTGTGGTENLGYDELNRLKGSAQGTTHYALNGNITDKPDVSGATVTVTSYDVTRPHAVRTFNYNSATYTIDYDGNGNVYHRGTAGDAIDVAYAGFDKPRWMTRTKAGIVAGSEFLYNANRSRIMQLEYDQVDTNGVPTHYVRKRTYGLGSTLELNYNATTSPTEPWKLKKIRIYVPGPDGVVGSREWNTGIGVGSGDEKAYIYHYDHLGSIESITPFGDTTGALAADAGAKSGRFSEDAWGQRRNPFTWSGAPLATGTNKSDDGGFDSLTPRGFTGHEMLDDLGLVHMNGRIYDPLLGRFLSADLVVPDPSSLQSYNRYSYVRNNPLSLTDPSGFTESDKEKEEKKEDEVTKRIFFVDKKSGKVVGGVDITGSAKAVDTAVKTIADTLSPVPNKDKTDDGSPAVTQQDGVPEKNPSSDSKTEGGPLLKSNVSSTYGFVDDFGNKHASFCLSCHAPTPEARFNKQQHVLANLLDWKVIAYEQLLGAGLTAGFGMIAEDLTAARSIVTVYRVEGLANTRLIINESGRVAITGDNMLFLNFGSRARAEEFLALRLAQNMEGVQLKSFEVPRAFLDELRSMAVPERMAARFPNNPIIVDPTKAPHQIGLRSPQIDEMRRMLIEMSEK